ncbi:sporulation histidine kinase inhibitor Sda [Paenibacillus athensensis]|uniref:Sporulation histidine kinase inhibitor Sda n=1 Tax=Paenibacillus athensensis TaxID=1967502 RepID=A0A4Y8Q0M7_9BACL|nr:sporulation histidine kinase inhibitor Sda [Paenibacillus athensensis]
MMLNLLSNERLIEVYLEAEKLQIEEQFIELLGKEMQRRKLNISERDSVEK